MRRFVVLIALLGACRDRGVKPRTIAAADSADQVYDSMTFNIVRDGIKSSRVTAESAWVYQGRQVADLKNMTVVSFDSSGAVISTITSDRGVYGMREQSLDARGHVIARSPGGKVLKTEHLIFDRNKNKVSSDTAFTSTAPQANISGAWFESDPGFKNIVVHRLRGGQKGKGIPLPGQPGGSGK